MYLLGTDVLLDLFKKEPCTSVMEWCNAVSPEHLYISVLSVGMLRAKLGSTGSIQQRSILLCWLKSKFTKWFDVNIIPIDLKISERWSDLCLLRGYDAIDGLLAATAIEKNLVFVTSNAIDGIEGLKLFDPFI